MMGKQNDAMEISAWTSGAGIAIGTNVDIGGVIIGSVATTVTLVDSDGTVFEVASSTITHPIGANGPLTSTSSGGSAGVIFRARG